MHCPHIPHSLDPMFQPLRSFFAAPVASVYYNYNAPHTCILMEMGMQSVWLILCYPSDTSMLNCLNHLIVVKHAPGAILFR